MHPVEAIEFEAVIVPHRSLGPNGLRWVLGGLLGLSAIIACVVWLLGAWPVIGFSGIEVMLAVWLLHRHAKSVRATEMLLLGARGIQIVRTDDRGRRWERRLDGGWLRVALEERPGRAPALVVQERGRRIEVGAALGEVEKRQLAAALADAVDRQRNPTFDNAQLRADPNRPEVRPPPGPST